MNKMNARSVASTHRLRAGPIMAMLNTIIVAAFCSLSPAIAFDNSWSTPLNLSRDKSSPGVLFPQIVADSRQHLHVIWSDTTYNEQHEPDAIFYVVWDGVRWSAPIDILVSPGGGTLYHGRLLAFNDRLQLIWTGDNRLYFSDAMADRAQLPKSWVTRPVAQAGATAYYPYMTRGEKGQLYVAFVSLEEKRLYLISSNDQGVTWTNPSLVWAAPDADSAPWLSDLIVDKNGTLHIAWTENAKKFSWNPAGIWYSRSLDGGKTWQRPLNVPDQGSQASLGLDADGNLHLVWNHNAGSKDGRYHMVSTNGGLTWSKPDNFFGPSGRTWFPAMAQDSAGMLHLIMGGNNDRGVSLIYWSYWAGRTWANPIVISGTLIGRGDESPDLAVSEGNKVNAVWRYIDENANVSVWYSSTRTSAPLLQTNPSPLPASTRVSTSTPAAVEMTATPDDQATPTSASAGSFPGFESRGSEASASTAQITVMGVLPALVIIVLVLAGTLARGAHH